MIIWNGDLARGKRPLVDIVWYHLAGLKLPIAYRMCLHIGGQPYHIMDTVENIIFRGVLRWYQGFDQSPSV